MSYADKLSIPFVVIIGEDEINAGVVAVKNMKTGEQIKETPEAAAERISAAIKEMNSGCIIKG